MAVATVSSPTLAPGLFGLGFGRPFGEGGGLAFGLAAYMIEFCLGLSQFPLEAFVVQTQPLVLSAKAVELSAQVVQVRQQGDGHGHRLTDLDGRRYRHGCLKKAGLASSPTLQSPARHGKRR